MMRRARICFFIRQFQSAEVIVQSDLNLNKRSGHINEYGRIYTESLWSFNLIGPLEILRMSCFSSDLISRSVASSHVSDDLVSV